MGSGKGNVEWNSGPRVWLQAGILLFEIDGMSARSRIPVKRFDRASAKLSVSTAFVKRQVRT